MTLLEVKNLTVTGPDAPLIRDLDFAIDPGERVGLIGESGSGKSLTCLSIMGLLPENLHPSGSIRLSGVDHDLLAAPESVMSPLRGMRMSMIFQEPMAALNPVMKVGRQVAEIITLHGSTDARIAADRAVGLLDQVGLPDPGVAAHAYPHQLSGGQRQRVMLAMAMANSPDLLLADEPTTALDVTVQAQVLDLMRDQVRDSGSALLFITHDLAVVSGLCERVLIMKDGVLVESGEIDRVFSAPSHPYTQDLLAASALTATSSPPPTLHAEGSLKPRNLRRVGSSVTPHQPGTGQRSPITPGSTGVDVGLPAPVRHDVLAEDASTIFNSGVDRPVVSVRDLTRTFHRGRTSLFGGRRAIHALRQVSFDLAAGTRFGIVGESGSGKSTLLRLLSALDTPTAGSAEVAGIELAGVRGRRLRPLRDQVQIVFQDPHSSLDPRMRVRDVVAEPLRGLRSDVRRDRVGDMLEAVGLPAAAADRFPHQFSGGQRQRIAIARALINEPSILLADEAVSALDVSVRAQVLRLLSDLIDQHDLTLIFVSHDLNVIRQLCDVVAVMQSGRIVECGPTEQLYADPRHAYTRQLLSALPVLQS